MKRIILFLFAFTMQITYAQNTFPSTGNVGIGIHSPVSGLQVFKLNDFNGGSVRFGHSGSYNALLSFGWNPNALSDSFKISYAPHNSLSNIVDLLTINLNGNVGIGTNSPEGLIDMKKTSTNAGGQAVLNLIGSTWAGDGASLVLNQLWNDIYYKTIIDNNGSNYGQTGSGLKIQTSYWNGSDVSTITALSLTPSGNLGIGKINPVNKLDVNGTIHSKEVKVDMTGWSDFVFRKEYELPSLEEVEKHITEKGHLENIPSEDEVLKNGINLGEMNAKLLQKIEEMTLYIIQQDKEIKTLAKAISTFKNVLGRLSKIEEKLETK